MKAICKKAFSTSKNAMKEELLRKLSRAGRAKDNAKKVKEIEKLSQVDYQDPEVNTQLLVEEI